MDIGVLHGILSRLNQIDPNQYTEKQRKNIAMSLMALSLQYRNIKETMIDLSNKIKEIEGGDA